VKTPPVGYPVILALAALVAGLYAYSRLGTTTGRSTAPGTTSSATRPALPTGSDTAGPEAPQEPAPPAAKVPTVVPDVKLPDLDGKIHSLQEGVGHPRILNFWATWCEPCLREIPLLNTLQATHAGEGLQVIGIAMDLRDAVAKFMKQTPLRYRVLVGEEEGLEAAQKFGMGFGLPFSVFADGENRIVTVKLGELHADEAAAILANMREARAGTVTLEAARQNIADALRRLAAERAKQTAQN
jgi:thiol-disulfide isomerase/thioredoxin